MLSHTAWTVNCGLKKKIKLGFVLYVFEMVLTMTLKLGSLIIKFIYSEKATKFCEISTVDLTITTQDKSMVEISQKNCGLLRTYELYEKLFQLNSDFAQNPNSQPVQVVR